MFLNIKDNLTGKIHDVNILKADVIIFDEVDRSKKEHEKLDKSISYLMYLFFGKEQKITIGLSKDDYSKTQIIMDNMRVKINQKNDYLKK